MKFINTLLAVILLSCFLSAGVAPTQSPNLKDSEHSAMHLIVMVGVKPEDEASCTAYAIAPHVLLTAQHCDMQNSILIIDNAKEPTEIAEKVYDNMDHMLLVVPTANFTATINYDPTTYKPPVQGEHVYYWGNPGELRDQYREGYMTGTYEPNLKKGFINAHGPFYIFALAGGPGDSGSAVFGSDGRIVTVVTFGLDGGQLMGGYPLAFTPEQLHQVTTFKALPRFTIAPVTY